MTDRDDVLVEKIDKIDELRDRFNISYSDAKRALEYNDWDLVEALVYLEEQEEVNAKKSCREEFVVGSSELVSKIKEIIKKGNATKIRVKKGDKVLVDIPIGLGAVGALLLPYLAVLSVIVAMFKQCTLEVYKKEEEPAETKDDII